MTVSHLVSLESIRAAAADMEGVVQRTALLPADALTDRVGVPVWLKPENRQPSGAFKLRGAWTAIRRLAPERRAAGVVTYSSGNHGQAVAYAAHQLGVRAVVVMPEMAPAIKVAGVHRWGGEVVLAGRTSDDRFVRAQELVRDEGLTEIPPFDHPDIIAGQGTVGLEILADGPEVHQIVVPVGGGGLCAGICAAVRGSEAPVQVTAVEPVGAAAYRAALAEGRPVRLRAAASVADGLLPLAVGGLTFEHMQGVAVPITVTDAAIIEATRMLARDLGILAEPSGAATTAALLSGTLDLGGPIVLVVSGGNIDPATIDHLQPACVDGS